MMNTDDACQSVEIEGKDYMLRVSKRNTDKITIMYYRIRDHAPILCGVLSCSTTTSVKQRVLSWLGGTPFNLPYKDAEKTWLKIHRIIE